MNEFSGNLSDFRPPQPPPRPRVGDLVLIHGHVAKVIAEDENGEHGGFLYRTSADEEVFYSAKWPIEPEPKCLWILEQ